MICLSFSSALGQSIAKPVYTYLSDFSMSDTSGIKLNGRARVINVDGRKGLNMTSIKSILELTAHNLKSDMGTVTMWVMSLEELSAYDPKPAFSMDNPHFFIYPLLSDCPDPQDFERANFKLFWWPRWHPSMVALFAKGNLYQDAFEIPHRALVEVSHFTFDKNIWYQFALTWDYKTDQYALFVDGVQIGREDQNHVNPFHRDSINTSLFLGNPTLCYSEINFYNEVFTKQQAFDHYKSETTRFDRKLNDELFLKYVGVGRLRFIWKPDPTWKLKWNVTLTKPSDMDSLYVQGNPVKVEITNEGLLMETVNKEYTSCLLDSQVYVWSNRAFEGNLYVEYEFKVLQPGGLSLLMVQASGMNREDFMADYQLKTTGRMVTVYGEAVRNYHWEYYREMADMRNDLENSALIKNPFLYPLSFGAKVHRLKKVSGTNSSFCKSEIN